MSTTLIENLMSTGPQCFACGRRLQLVKAEHAGTGMWGPVDPSEAYGCVGCASIGIFDGQSFRPPRTTEERTKCRDVAKLPACIKRHNEIVKHMIG